ncbi:hypothetical protein ACNKHS_02575 [Shigella flexneri]
MAKLFAAGGGGAGSEIYLRLIAIIDGETPADNRYDARFAEVE